MRMWWVRKLVRLVYPQLPIDFSVEQALVNVRYKESTYSWERKWVIFYEDDVSYKYIDEEGKECTCYKGAYLNDRYTFEVIKTLKKVVVPTLECKLYEEEFERRLAESRRKVRSLKRLDEIFRFIHEETKEEKRGTTEELILSVDPACWSLENYAEYLTKGGAKYKGWINNGK